MTTPAFKPNDEQREPAEGVVIIDISGTTLLVNPGIELLSGYRAEEVTGKHFSWLYSEEELHAGNPADHLKKAAAEGRVEGREWLVRKDGSRFWATVIITALRDENGTVQGFAVAARDIDERSGATEALQKAERKLRSIVEHSTNLFYVHTADNILTYVSPQSRQFLDCEPEEALVHWTEFITDNPVNRGAIEATQRAIDTGQRQPPYLVECIGRTGRKLWVEVNETPVIENGKTVAVVGSLTDITERKRSEEAQRFSEERYRALFRDNPTMIVTLDAALTMLSVNPACASQLGYTIDELEGQSILKLFREDDHPAVAKQLQSCLQHPNQVYRWQLRKVRKDGELLWVEEIAQAIHDLNGALNVLVVCQDVTERRRAEEALRKSELKLAKIFHSVPAMIGITTVAEGRCIDINEAGLRTLGYRREEMVGRTMLELGVWESKSVRDRVIRVLEEEGMVRDLEINFRGKSGKTFTGLFSAEPIDFDGERYILSIVNDITERKRMEEEIVRLNRDLEARAAELEAANRELEAFNYTVAHDLRKPLAVVNGYCQVIQELCGERLDERCKEYVQEIFDGTWRMNGLIDILLKFSRLTHIEPVREAVDLSSVARMVTMKLAQSEPGRRVEFRITGGISVIGDANLLQVVLENLIGNAWKYTGNREEAVIEFGATEIDGKPVYFVRDNGTGFDMSCRERMFQPFQRLPGTEEFSGHGIGLATVERIIGRHGGKVWAEGMPGKGACFYFSL
jgi:PAS domain S-box-containing protein